MEPKTKKALKKPFPPVSSIVMYVVAVVVALIAISSLVNNITLFQNVVAQYVAQGYDYNQVVKQLTPGQLIPGIFEPIAVYGGIAFVIFCAGLINQKVSKCLKLLEVNAGDADTTEQAEVVNEISEVADGPDQR